MNKGETMQEKKKNICMKYKNLKQNKWVFRGKRLNELKKSFLILLTKNQVIKKSKLPMTASKPLTLIAAKKAFWSSDIEEELVTNN